MFFFLNLVWNSQIIWSLNISFKFIDSVIRYTGRDRRAARPRAWTASGAQDPIRAGQRRRGRRHGTGRLARLLLRGPVRVRPEDPGTAPSRRLWDRRHHTVRGGWLEREANPAGHRPTSQRRSYGPLVIYTNGSPGENSAAFSVVFGALVICFSPFQHVRCIKCSACNVEVWIANFAMYPMAYGSSIVLSLLCKAISKKNKNNAW